MTRFAFLFLAAPALAQPLPGTQPLALSGDPAKQMVDGILRYLVRATEASVARRKPDRGELRRIIGAVDRRVESATLELAATTAAPALLYEDADLRVWAVRWPVLDGVTAEGLHFVPKRAPAARIVLLPDADQAPEDVWIAWRFARSGCEVLVPALIERKDTWSGNPKFRMTNQPHREFIYRMAFPVGRHIIGYEVQKALAAVDWFARQPKAPLGVWGYGEGGLLALYATALDDRIDAAVVSGYFQPREELWQEPIYRNVWGLLKNFGDAEIARLVAPRRLLIETRPGPVVSGPPPADAKRRGAAPGVLRPAALDQIRREAGRAGLTTHAEATSAFLGELGVRSVAPDAAPPALPRRELTERQFGELVDYTQKLVRQSEARRAEYWSKADPSSPQRWLATKDSYREYFLAEIIGLPPPPALPLNPRTRRSYQAARWTGYEVTLDLYPDVFAYGVLLLPSDITPGERRPVVVCQHGLNGRPQSMFGLPEIDAATKAPTDFRYYQNIGSKLADLGFIVYMPQNPYIGEFREINRLANPLKLSMFSFILAQNERLLDWLVTLPQVDPARIAFYGLSYGGKTALRIPALLDRYALSICSGDFNEWIVKLTTVEAGYSYMFTHEYEIGEFDLASVANHAEMAWMIAPRPFMVERGHRDGVGVDEWVA